MALSEFAGIFSRAFVVGYFVPALVTLVAADAALPSTWRPSSYTSLDAGAQILVLGAVALVLGLLLSGLQYPILRMLEGYPLQALAQGGPRIGGRRLNPALIPLRVLLWRQHRRFDRLTAVRNQPERSPERTAAGHELARSYPAARNRLLPTDFGNTIRSFEWHPRARYGLDGITAYPRIAALLSEQERELVSDAQADVAFFVNVVVLSVAFWVAVLVDKTTHGLDGVGGIALLAGPVLLALWAYRVAVGAAERWGHAVRANFDLHRLTLYDKLGLKQPATQEEEFAIARAANRWLLFAELPADTLRKLPDPPKEDTS